MFLSKLIIMFFVNKNFAMSLGTNYTNLACTSHPRNYGPMQKIRSQFVKMFLEPLNLNKSLNASESMFY